ncbi:MAG: hypothetical protein IJO13_00630 [Lachnospiraceae bacterium]|nr:hypothetical protein [Lachnospiraceae bacterium]
MERNYPERLLTYELIDRRIRKMIKKAVEEDLDISVKGIAEMSNVSLSTAYKHRTGDLIREAIREADEKRA